MTTDLISKAALTYHTWRVFRSTRSSGVIYENTGTSLEPNLKGEHAHSVLLSTSESCFVQQPSSPLGAFSGQGCPECCVLPLFWGQMQVWRLQIPTCQPEQAHTWWKGSGVARAAAAGIQQKIGRGDCRHTDLKSFAHIHSLLARSLILHEFSGLKLVAVKSLKKKLCFPANHPGPGLNIPRCKDFHQRGGCKRPAGKCHFWHLTDATVARWAPWVQWWDAPLGPLLGFSVCSLRM